jgi:predicted negative regulator of RcsB-dependent stress response
MAVYDLEEQEKIDDLKAFWRRWGNAISAAVIAVCVAYAGVQGWRWYQDRNANEAAVLYSAVAEGVRTNDVAKARDAMGQLAQRFEGTAYAPRAAMLYAKLAWDQGDKAGAKTQYQWIVDNATEDELKQVARYRLAQALLDEKQPDRALATLDAKHDEAFAGLYADLRGDALAVAGRHDDARSAYQTALAKLDAKSPYRNYVQVKLDALPGGAPPAAGSAAAATATPSQPAAAAAATAPAKGAAK